MPRVTLGTDMTMVSAVISKYLRLRHIPTVGDLAPSAGVSRRTMYDRMEHPEEFRLKEIDGVYRKLQVPYEERVYS